MLQDILYSYISIICVLDAYHTSDEKALQPAKSHRYLPGRPYHEVRNFLNTEFP